MIENVVCTGQNARARSILGCMNELRRESVDMRTMISARPTGGGELASITWPEGSSVVQLARADCDIADSGAVSRAVHRIRPDAIVNAAAYTAVDRAESEPNVAHR